MSYRIGLYHDSTLYGEIELESLFVMGPADYTCRPQDVVSCDQVQQIAKVLRRAPEMPTGVIGPYDWRQQPN
jgi:hypothetical protein